MDLFDFNDSLDAATNTFNDPEIKDWLSYNGQLFLRCQNCERTLWCNPLYIRNDREKLIGKLQCDKCKKRKFQLCRFIRILELSCGFCSTMIEFDSRKPVACKTCGSTTYEILNVQEFPGYPSSFGTAFEPKEKDWCIDIQDDLRHLHETIRGFRHGASFHANCIHLIQFFRDLYNRGEYPESVGLKSELINSAALLLRQLFRETGDIKLGISSVEVMEEATKLVSDDLSLALYNHNVATHFYGMLAKGMEKLADVMMQRQTRAEAIEYAMKALELYSKCDELDEQTRPIKCAEVEWLIGDIIGADHPGDPALVESVAWYDKALDREGLSERLVSNIVDSRDSKIRKMQTKVSIPEPRRSSTELFPRDERPEKDFVERMQHLETEVTSALDDDDLQRAANTFCEMYGLIRYQLCSTARDTIIRNYGTQMMRSVGAFASFLASAHSPISGLVVHHY